MRVHALLIRTTAPEVTLLSSPDPQAMQDWLSERPDSVTLNSGGMGGERTE